MGRETTIAWTDHTFNPWWGCTKVSPGCDHCYAEAFDKRVGGSHWGKGQTRREFGEKHWNEPLKWNRDALNTFGRTARVFCASMADVMDDEAPAGARERLWALIDETPNLVWQLLTKRPHRYRRYLPKRFRHNNVWLGTTAENQEFFNKRWPILNAVAQTHGLTSFISYEPALEPISIRQHKDVPNWIIFGGESGARHRPCETEWARQVMADCEARGIKFFMKQMSGRTPNTGKAAVPVPLRVHEFPYFT